MKKLTVLIALFMTSLLGSTLVLAESAYFVQSASAKILAQPSFRSKIVTEVRMGEKLVAIGKEGNWIKVSVAGKEGYISSLLLSSHPPMKKTEVIKADETEINQGVRRRASSFSSAAAARGLTKEDRVRADNEDEADYVAVKKMEAVKVKPQEVDQFSTESKK